MNDRNFREHLKRLSLGPVGARITARNSLSRNISSLRTGVQGLYMPLYCLLFGFS